MSLNRSPVGRHEDSNKVKLSNSLNRPKSAGASGGSAINLSPATKTRRKGSPIMHKLVSLFKRNPDNEEGVVPVRPSCFDDDRYQRRSESPEAVDGGKRRNSNNSAKQFKIKKGGVGKEKPPTRMWRSKVGAAFHKEKLIIKLVALARVHNLGPMVRRCVLVICLGTYTGNPASVMVWSLVCATNC